MHVEGGKSKMLSAEGCQLTADKTASSFMKSLLHSVKHSGLVTAIFVNK